jgi:hypothetical protein
LLAISTFKNWMTANDMGYEINEEKIVEYL